MEHMKLCLLVIFLVLLAPNLNLVQGLRKPSQAEEMELEKQLKLINKPAVKSFQTEYGEILDCVEIHKQLAFDHPLLKNHSIEMKSNIPRLGRPSSRQKASLVLPNNIRCPRGTVLIKRVQKEDLLMAKFSPSFWTNQPPPGHQIATLVMPTQKRSKVVHGNVNVWGPYAGPNQFTSGSIFVASEDGTQIANGIATGWMVNPTLYPDKSRLYAFWSRDSGMSTGCYNMLCPGFVQVSQEITLGLILQPLSTYGGPQYEIELSIHQQENGSGNWWIQFGKKDVGYYPKEIFTTLVDGATHVGWGGEVYSPDTQPTPAMGSGHFPDEGFGQAAFIRQLYALDSHYGLIYIHEKELEENMTKPQCYKAKYGGFSSQNDTGHYMLYGGPPNC